MALETQTASVAASLADNTPIAGAASVRIAHGGRRIVLSGSHSQDERTSVDMGRPREAEDAMPKRRENATTAAFRKASMDDMTGRSGVRRSHSIDAPSRGKHKGGAL